MSMMARGKKLNNQHYTSEDDWPLVSVLMAAYNEEAVLKDKLDTLYNQDYPIQKIKIYIGSDNSSDSTNQILEDYAAQYSNLHATYFTSRQGKPKIINQLVKQVHNDLPDQSDHVFLMTDASVMLRSDTLSKLVRHFKNEEVGLVDAHMTYTGMRPEGISTSENTYLNSEVTLKQNESKIWEKMIGPFGGCFAMRSELYTEVPSNYLVDDFYLAMKVLSQGYKAINDLEAVCDEPVSHKIEEEFKRKKRISTGNFQNLFHFRGLLNPFSTLGFSYLSHKVLRWIGPLLMLVIALSSLLLAIKGSAFFIAVTVGQLIWYIVIPIGDRIFRALGIQLSALRNVSYFNVMNWALLRGFFSFLSGVKSSIWEPTKRA